VECSWPCCEDVDGGRRLERRSMLKLRSELRSYLLEDVPVLRTGSQSKDRSMADLHVIMIRSRFGLYCSGTKVYRAWVPRREGSA
jgi:hypothetical protein